jgi:hypothetical protein
MIRENHAPCRMDLYITCWYQINLFEQKIIDFSDEPNYSFIHAPIIIFAFTFLNSNSQK